MKLFLDIQKSISLNKSRNAFHINGVFYTYSDFAMVVSKIRKSIQSNTLESNTNNIGLVINDDLETYSAIIALWFEGKAYVPLKPENPRDRNANIIKESDIEIIIDSSDRSNFLAYNLIESKKLLDTSINLMPKEISDEDLAYLFFTSGTTGTPKGVPIKRENIAGFIEAFWDMGFDIDENDKFLQMFDLTFDLSVMSYLVPLLKGACIYTIPKDKIKFSYIYKLMDEQKLTFALMVPSILQYLRKHFDEIHFPEMKYSLFCGEALPNDITAEWSECLPNAKIYNVYGPTEDTIFCTYYSFNRERENKSHNGVLSIGKAMKGTKTIIIDDDNQILIPGEMGELCLGGIQLTPNYWKNEELNEKTFFYKNINGIDERFYRTGDLCMVDRDGDIMFLGRVDFQVQIQGFRVELTEVEYYGKLFLEKINMIAITIVDPIGNSEIAIVIESKEFSTIPLMEYFKSVLPSYMMPRQIKFIDRLPLNTNGKTDRKKLQFLLTSS